MNIYISINGHANRSSLPLRFGLKLLDPHQSHCKLENATYDEVGTKSQRQNEIESGRRHYVGDLIIPKPKNAGNYSAFRCRLILDTPKSSELKPSVVTILQLENNKGDLTVTRHLEGMLKRGKINTDDLIKYYHPAYVRGEVQDSNDCESIWEKDIRPQALMIETIDAANTAIKEGLLASGSNFKAIMAKEVNGLKSPLMYERINLPNVQNVYVMADAYINKAWREKGRIMINFIDSKGVENTMSSFPLNERLNHLEKLHEYAFNYLVTRQEQRAKFAICVSPKYMGTLAESVTAIALQISRRGDA